MTADPNTPSADAPDRAGSVETLYRHIVENANEGVWILDPQAKTVFANRRMAQMLGAADADRLQGRTMFEFLFEDEREEARRRVSKRLASGGSTEFEFRFRRQDGTELWTHISATLLCDADGRPRFEIGLLTDITRQKQAEQRLRESELHYRSLFEHMLEGYACCRMLFKDGSPEDFVYLKVNSAFERLTGLADVEGKRVSEVIPGIRESNPELFEVYGRVALTGRPEKLESYVPDLGLWFSVTVYSIEKEHFVAVFDNITERKAAGAQIEFLANHDPLTRLPNRLLVRDRFQQAVAGADRGGTKLALAFLDIDNFKLINDSLGHGVGDELLQAVAARLGECVRDTDTLSRQGGDEFLLLLPEVRDAESVACATTKLLLNLAEPFPISSHSLNVTVSVGIALYPDDGTSFDALLQKADTAMYRAKGEGRNACRFYDWQMNQEADEHHRIRNSLRLAEARGELELFYQPLVNLASGAVAGAEALIRWRHPELGLLLPGKFIAIAEDSGLIVPIGEWVLREACRQAAAFQQAGQPEFVMAVNLSAVQFKRGDLLRTVIVALSEADLDPALLELELTESVLIGDTDAVLQTVRSLKALGVKLSIDDFGTGYSSLSYLKRFAVDKLKIDQSFIRDLAADSSDAAIVRAIIQMARSLGLKTIAEGVEEERPLDYLRVYHCDEAQGYYFAHPMPADEFARYLARQRIPSFS